MAESTQQPAMHAPDDIHVRGVAWGAAAIALGVALAALVSYLLWQWWNVPAGVPNTRDVPAIGPPVLQSAPQPERAQYFADKERLLTSWAWIDRRAGLARIPVEEAMRIMASRSGGKAASAPREEQR